MECLKIIIVFESKLVIKNCHELTIRDDILRRMSHMKGVDASENSSFACLVLIL